VTEVAVLQFQQLLFGLGGQIKGISQKCLLNKNFDAIV
jgi:hypothetical protein